MVALRRCGLILLFNLAAFVLAQEPPRNVVHPLPPQAPAWLPGHELRWPVRVVGEPAKQSAKTVIVSIPTGGRIKPDASDLAVQASDGSLRPFVVLSHDPLGSTVIQFHRRENDPWYWVYAGGPPGLPADPKTDPSFREGLTLELRDFTGTPDDLGAWAKVREGLAKGPVIGNAVVGEVVQAGNPARPDDPKKFAASYRGYFNIAKEGTYSFFANADDAAFLFIDGFKVFERPGQNRPLGGIKVSELAKISGKVDLKVGVHSFEVHHACGERPEINGVCALSWATPDQPKFQYLPSSAVVHPLYARTAALERKSGSAPTFHFGNEDLIEAGGPKLFLVKFEAAGPLAPGEVPVWDFGDGTTGTGISQTHVYFKEGDYTVSVSSPKAIPFRKRIRVWPEPGETGPLSLGTAVEALERMEWKKLDVGRVREIFAYLLRCQQPNRWKLLDEVAQFLLEKPGPDLETRSQFIVARIEALTALGKSAEALALGDKYKPDFARTPSLWVRVQLAMAAVHQYSRKDAAAAGNLYKAILEENGRIEHPNIRMAAVRWGDLYAELGDFAKADETYRYAATLGGEKFAGPAVTDASTRGGLLRIAEQKLKAGDIIQTRQLLDRLELEFPGRRTDGLYCYLRAEVDRTAGRYDDALRHYEAIFKLTQWAGYRDRAGFGLAQTYLRMGDIENAKKWLADVKRDHAVFFAERKGAELEKAIEERASRGTAAFKFFECSFEPGSNSTQGVFIGFDAVRAPGLGGSHAGWLDAHPREIHGFSHDIPLTNLVPGTTYWVEFWYRDEVKLSTPPANAGPHFGVSLQATADTKIAANALSGVNVLRNSHHQWHRAGFKIVCPAAADCTLKIGYHGVSGVTLIDGIRVRPVSDAQLDALFQFTEAAKAP